MKGNRQLVRAALVSQWAKRPAPRLQWRQTDRMLSSGRSMSPRCRRNSTRKALILGPLARFEITSARSPAARSKSTKQNPTVYGPWSGRNASQEGTMKTDTVDRPRVVEVERYRWIVLLIAWLSFLISFIDRLTWANVAVSAGASLGLSVAELGVVVTAFY